MVRDLAAAAREVNEIRLFRSLRVNGPLLNGPPAERKFKDESISMGLFTADLYRSFATGFGIGAIALGVTITAQATNLF